MMPRQSFKIAVALQTPMLLYVLLVGVTVMAADMTLGLLGVLLLLYLPATGLSSLGFLFFFYTVWKCTTSIDDLYLRLNRLERKVMELKGD